MAMNHYRYEALNADQQVVTGEVQAASLSEAVAQLEAQGLTLRVLAESTVRAASAAPQPVGASATEAFSATEQEVLQQHMRQVLDRTRDILPALQAYAQDLPAGHQRRQLQTVLKILERGNAAQAASGLAALPGYWIPLLSAAASSRDPGRVLREFLEESRRAEDLYRQWWLTLAYPLCLLGLASLVLVALSFLVIPVFRDIFLDFQISLPLPTKIVFSIAEWIASGRVLVSLAVALAIGALLWLLWRCLPAAWRNGMSDRWGSLLGRGIAIARFSQFAADLLEAELPPQQAVRLAGIAVASAPVRRAAWRVAGALDAGQSAAAPDNVRVLTHTILSVFQSGLPGKTQIRLLREIGTCYAQRVENSLSWARGIVEPIAIWTIGLIVGITVLALFLPLIRLVSFLAG